MLRLPKITKEDASAIRQIEERLQDAISRAESTCDPIEQEGLLNEIADLERRLNVAQSRHLLLAIQTQGLEVKEEWLVSLSGLQWLTSEGQGSIRSALRRRRREDWTKLLPMLISTTAILISVGSAIVTSRASQQKDFLLNRSWLSAEALWPSLIEAKTTQPSHFLLKFSNHGRAPALHAIASGRALATTADETAFESITRDSCDRVAGPTGFGGFVPPGASSESSLEVLSNPQPAPVVMILGCIGYEDALDHKRHVTSFGFRSPPVVKSSGKGDSTGSWIPYSLGYGIAR